MTAGVEPRVAVLGAGMAGVAAAVELARHGLRPVLIESRPYLGGRTRSFVHERTGDAIDNGQHLLMGCYHATFRLLDRLGTRDLIALQKPLHVPFRDADGTRTALKAPPLPSPLDVLIAMLRLRGISVRERWAVLRLGLAAMRGTAYEHETVADYLARLGQTPTLRRRLWDPLVIATLNLSPEVASARLFVRVMQRAFLGRGDDSKLAFPTVELGRLLAPAREVIERHGGTVLMGTPITAIEPGGDAFTVHLKEREPVIATSVISALPERSLRMLLGETGVARAVFSSTPPLNYAPIVSLYLWYDRPLTAFPLFSAVIGTHIQWIFNRRAIDRTSNDRFPGLLCGTISAAFEESGISGDEMARIVDAELRRAFDELHGATLVDALVVKEKHATFACTPAVEPLRPMARTAAAGFYLAGDWTATGLPATIEGAVQSGFEAADAVRQDRRDT